MTSRRCLYCMQYVAQDTAKAVCENFSSSRCTQQEDTLASGTTGGHKMSDEDRSKEPPVNSNQIVDPEAEIRDLKAKVDEWETKMRKAVESPKSNGVGIKLLKAQ